MRQATDVVYPPNAQWVQEFLELKQPKPVQNTARHNLGHFTRSVMDGAAPVKMEFEIPGIIYEKALKLALQAREFLKKNGMPCSMQITKIERNAPFNSIKISSGNHWIKFKEKIDRFDMLKEACENK